MISEILNSEFIVKGGTVQIFLLALSVLTVAAILDRAMVLSLVLIHRMKESPEYRLVSSGRFTEVVQMFLLYCRACAPLLGILGTVLGIIKAFSRIGGQKVLDMTALAGDLSMALYTTAFGLVIALLCIAGLFFNDTLMDATEDDEKEK